AAAVSLPLVNVRYAVSRGVGRRLLERASARQIVGAEAALYCPERTWPEVRRVGQFQPELGEYCAEFDLKREDARQAVSAVKQMLGDAGTLASLHRRRRDVPFVRSELTRERGDDVTGGADPERLPRL